MLDKSTYNRMVHLLRRQFTWSKCYKNILKRNLVSPKVLKCEGCERFICKDEQTMQLLINGYPELEIHAISLEKYAIDHIVPVGTLTPEIGLDEAANRIFCEESNLMGLCMTCHYWKTRVDVEDIIQTKKSLIDKIQLGEI